MRVFAYRLAALVLFFSVKRNETAGGGAVVDVLGLPSSVGWCRYPDRLQRHTQDTPITQGYLKYRGGKRNRRERPDKSAVIRLKRLCKWIGSGVQQGFGLFSYSTVYRVSSQFVQRFCRD
ncbi:hypothetical protein J6590_077478 [Homalodisca vitripennis]|nr:hypothetical protein J6590_077476 [Homalodisca vitripennis]KAG8320056.1 hypothetical protein J6590_077478 [Homalodisca vitripennis]